MITVRYIEPDLTERVVQVQPGQTLMQAAVNNRVRGIVAECGGACMCATCHVYVEESHVDRLKAVDATEDEMLEAVESERQDNSRLSCQIKATPEIDGIVVRIAPVQV